MLFWKAIESTQIMISDKGMSAASNYGYSEMTFAECTIVSKSLDSELKLLVCGMIGQ